MKSLFKITLFLILPIFAIFMFTGCGTKLKVERQTGELDLKLNTKLKKEEQTNKVIGIVDSSFVLNGVTKNKNLSDSIDAKTRQFVNALSVSVTEIISAKGFKLKGPYKTFDDITYSDKKMIYLSVVPKLDVEIKAEINSNDTGKLYKQVSGVLKPYGSLVLSVVEPMTGQVFIKRRIDLNSLNIEEPFSYGIQTSTGDGSISGALVDKAFRANTKLVDNTDVAVTNIYNKFYKYSMEQIQKYIDREEILSFENDILKLKGLKRF